MTKILVPTDFTPPSDAALDYAIDLAARLDSAVTLLHAYEIPVAGASDALGLSREALGQVRAWGQDRLDRIVAENNGRGVPVDALLREGRTSQTIQSAAREVGADLIVIGTHERSRLARALLGGVAEGLIRTGTVPVLAVRGSRSRGNAAQGMWSAPLWR